MPVVGRYKQGDPIPHEETAPRESATPSKAPLAGAMPRGEQHKKEAHKTVGANRVPVR